MKIPALLILVVLSGCSSHYPTPSPGSYLVLFHFVENINETKCKPGDAACMEKSALCHVYISIHDWEHYNNHELAHCLGINSHLPHRR